jgi:membrane associated rhomboid family serine protease
MLPLRDNIPSRRFPGVTLGIIALNLLMFFQELKLGPHLDQFMLVWGIVPGRYADAAHLFSLGEKILPLFSSMFLHGGWLHLIGNMWVLWIFGDNVEDRLGHFKYLGFYLLSGLAAALFHIFTNLHSVVPTIGASGAIAGVMGAYFRFFPRARVETLIPPFFFGPFFELPAIVFLGFWFLLQFFNGALSLAAHGQSFGGVAWWAHVGGFAFGLAVALLAGRTAREPWR